MLTSSVTLNFLKSYYKDIKSICKENPELTLLLLLLLLLLCKQASYKQVKQVFGLCLVPSL